MPDSSSAPSENLTVSATSLRNIIIEGDAKELVIQAETIGKKLAQEKLTTNQIRAIFGTVRKIEMDWNDSAHIIRQQQAQRQLILLKPKMAFRANKETNQARGLKSLTKVLGDSIDLVMEEKAVNKQERFGRFVEFFEAILAYHSVAGGK